VSAARILVVEDNSITRKMVRVALAAEGYEVVLAGDGATAIEAARASMPDLVLQDLVLPDMDGFTLVGRLRALPGGDAIPILAFTGLISRHEDARISAARFNGLLIKPVEPSRLIAAVKRYLVRPRAPQTLPEEQRHVLLVNDDPVLSRLHKLQLEHLGFHVSTAKDPKQALAKARREIPDVILADILMPRTDGFRFIAKVRADKRLAKVPVVLISAHFADDDDRLMVARLGAQGMLRRTPELEGAGELLAEVIRSGVSRTGRRQSGAVRNEEYIARVIAQLERQATTNVGVAQRASLQAAALAALAAIADALSRRLPMEPAMEQVVSQCIDAAGLSRGAVLLRQTDDTLRCAAQVGFNDAQQAELASLLGAEPFTLVTKQDSPVTIMPSEGTPAEAKEFLVRMAASSCLIAPITSGGVNHGALLLTSATRMLSGEDWNAFAHAIASQLGQAVALSRAFSTLEESEASSRTLFDGMPLGLFRSTPDGKIQEANPAILNMLGYAKREDLLAVHAPELYAEPKDRDRYIQQLRSTGLVRDFATVLRRRDGSEFPVELSARAVPGADGQLLRIDASIADVTERHLAETTLRDSEARFRQLAENIREVFFITEAVTGHCLYLSPAYESIFGQTCAMGCATPQAWADTVHPEDRDRVLAAEKVDLAPDGAIDVFRVVHQDKTVRWVRRRVFPVKNAAGMVYRIVGVAEDITELRRTEQQLIQAQKMEAVGQLAGGIAHDFNNLLGAITLFGELAAGDIPANDARREDLDSIQEAVQRATTLTRQLLAFSRQQVLNTVVLDPNTVISDLVKMLTRLIGEDVELITELAPDAGMVRADAGQLEQVLLNLTVNARDAMPSGGKIIIATTHATLSEDAARLGEIERAGDYTVITVSDNGAGMGPEVRAHVFEPFFSTKGARGTGLGLATVYGIIRQSGGHIAVISEPGRGTTFTIHLPMVVGAAASRVSKAEAAPSGGSETILLAEDDPAVRVAASTVLKRLGYTVIVARTAEDALTKAESHGSHIDMVVSDVVLPGMDGNELIQQLRRTHPDIKALLTSGYAGELIARRAVLEPDIPFLEKPFTSSRLAKKVRDVLDGAEILAAAQAPVTAAP
jgi:PAS domain S-box-containing protein